MILVMLAMLRSACALSVTLLNLFLRECEFFSESRVGDGPEPANLRQAGPRPATLFRVTKCRQIRLQGAEQTTAR